MWTIAKPTRLATVAVAAALVGFIGPAASAAVDPSPQPSSGGDSATSSDGLAADVAACTVTEQQRVNSHGKALPPKVRVDRECLAQLREERRLQREEARQERAEEREQIRSEGGTWGSVMRQDALIKVAEKLAEKHEQAPSSASLARILTLINANLPESLQIDVDAFLADYDLIFSDLVQNGYDDETDDDEGVEPSVEPSVEPEPEPSA
jgi:hypothetical protein